jgi:REJ domain
VNYSFLVVVSSLDGRSSQKTVVVSGSYNERGVVTYISNTQFRFNPDLKLVIQGTVTAAIEATSSWSILTSEGATVPFEALTSKTRTFSIADTIGSVQFPLSIDSGILTGGKTYTFRLTGHPTKNSKFKTYSEVFIFANPRPVGGSLQHTPSNGLALVTKFVISTPGWTSESENLPLVYSFSYRISEASAYLTLAAPSLRASATSTLPAGLRILNDTVTVRGKATDIYSSSATAVAYVEVQSLTSTNVSNIMSDAFNNAFLAGNINSVYETMNNVSHYYKISSMILSILWCLFELYSWKFN